MDKDQIMKDFKRVIALASKDTHDIVSAYEEIFDEFKKNYPQYSTDFDKPLKDLFRMFIDDI